MKQSASVQGGFSQKHSLILPGPFGTANLQQIFDNQARTPIVNNIR